MTRKDYIIIAGALDRQRVANAHHPALSGAQRAAAVAAIEATAETLASALLADNARFNRATFLRACGFVA